MSPRIQFAAIFAVYTIFIVGTFWISGTLTGRATLYDQYLARIDGAVITVSNVKEAERFYGQVLDFPAIKQGVPNELVAFQLPGERRLFLRTVQHENLNRGSSDAVITLRVRNGFEKLHREIVKRSGAPAVAISRENLADGVALLPAGRISEVLELEGGSEFVVKDPEGNKLIYFEPRKFVGERYLPLLTKSQKTGS